MYTIEKEERDVKNIYWHSCALTRYDNFPEQGQTFYHVAGALKDVHAHNILRENIHHFCEENKGKIDVVAAIGAQVKENFN